MKNVRNDTRPFIRFPLPLVREVLLHGAPALDVIMAYGVFRASLGINVETPNAYRQLMYYAARSQKDVPFNLLEVAEGFGCDLSECFVDGQIEPLILQEFREYCDGCLDVEELLEWYRVIVATTTTYKDVELPGARTILAIGKNHEELANGQVPVSVDLDMLHNFQQAMETDADRVKCAMYLGIRSLTSKGIKAAITTKQAILWRAFGCKNKGELAEVLTDEYLNKIYWEWSTRKKYSRLMNSLMFSGLVKSIPFKGRTLVSAIIKDDAEFRKYMDELSARSSPQDLREAVKKMQEKWLPNKH